MMMDTNMVTATTTTAKAVVIPMVIPTAMEQRPVMVVAMAIPLMNVQTNVDMAAAALSSAIGSRSCRYLRCCMGSMETPLVRIHAAWKSWIQMFMVQCD